MVSALLALEETLPGKLQLLVVCGDDERARRRLAKRAEESAMPMQVLGFVEYMADLMAVSDAIVAKAGGLTVSEALSRGLPLILYHIIPGQEYMNADYVSRQGAGVIADGPMEVAQAVRRFLEDPARFETMRKAAKALGRPNAAEAIVLEVVKPLLRSPTGI